jgi:two-component system OmpR family sensor kinase
VSLTLSGVLTGILVMQLQFNDTLDQMGKQALLLKPQVQQAGCQKRNLKGGCASTVPQMVDYLELNPTAIIIPPGDRLILLSRASRLTAGGLLIYDSQGTIAPGTPIPLGRDSTVSGQHVREGRYALDGTNYLVAGADLGTAQVSYAVLARPEAEVANQATSQLEQPILKSAAAGLLLAIVVTLVLGRAFAKPLRELRLAAEDIAGGNYGRRVKHTGQDEIGVVGRSFNRMAEAVERTRHQQRTFLANVSHELKTPLTSLIGFSQALTDGSLRTDDEKLRAAAIIHEEAQRVLRMSQELLDLARVESGQLALHPHPVDLGVQLQQEIELVRKRADTRRLALQLVVPAALPPVNADPDRLHQILDNLLDNAVKYAPEGTTVWISAEAGFPARITTTVRNRVGVRPPDPQRMFDRFYRGDSSRSSAGGVGLGLAISRELAIAQNGDLRARLLADGSLAVELDLPVAPQPPQWTGQPERTPVRLLPRPQLPG